MAKAAELLANTQGAPVSEFEAQQAARILPRLNRKLGFPVQRARVRHGWSSLALELPRPESPHPVELVVSEHLTTPQAPVLYVENTGGTAPNYTGFWLGRDGRLTPIPNST